MTRTFLTSLSLAVIFLGALLHFRGLAPPWPRTRQLPPPAAAPKLHEAIENGNEKPPRPKPRQTLFEGWFPGDE